MVAVGWQELPAVDAALLLRILVRSMLTRSAGWYSVRRNERRKRAIAEFTGRDLHLVKKGLAIAVLSIDRMLGPFQSG